MLEELREEILENRVLIEALTQSIGGHPVDVMDADNSTLPDSIHLPIDSLETLAEVDDLMQDADMRRRMVCKYLIK